MRTELSRRESARYDDMRELLREATRWCVRHAIMITPKVTCHASPRQGVRRGGHQGEVRSEERGRR